MKLFFTPHFTWLVELSRLDYIENRRLYIRFKKNIAACRLVEKKVQYNIRYQFRGFYILNYDLPFWTITWFHGTSKICMDKLVIKMSFLVALMSKANPKSMVHLEDGCLPCSNEGPKSYRTFSIRNN